MSIRISNPQAFLNSYTLKNLKQKVLKQAYEQELNKKSQRTAFSTNQENSDQDTGSTIKNSQSVGNLATGSRLRTGSKNVLYYDQEGEIQPRSLQKRETARRKLMEERDLLSTIDRHQSLEVERQRIAKEDYKRHLQEEIKRKHSLRELSKVEEQQLEKSKLHREASFRNKQSSFKEFYDNANKFRDHVANGYLQYVQSSKEKEQRERQRERYDLQQNRNLIKAQMLEEYKLKREKREQLKRALQQQMMQNQSMKVNEVAQFKNRGYVKFQSNNHNPIYNPIDYKMDLNNRYVLRQIIHHAQIPHSHNQ